MSIVGVVISPFNWGLILLIVSMAFYKKRKIACMVLMFSVLLLWVWSCNVTSRLMYKHLTRDVPFVGEMDAPAADVIVDLGGGVGYCDENSCPELYSASDRAYQAARLFKAARAKKVIVSGCGAGLADVSFLLDLGVPQDAIIIEDAARNTEENAKFVSDILCAREANYLAGENCCPIEPKCQVLLLTSVWHMKRSLLMFDKYAKGIVCIPIAGDFDLIKKCKRELSVCDFFPDVSVLAVNSILLKEIIGFYGYKWLK